MADKSGESFQEEMTEHVDNAASAVLAGYDEALKKYKELTDKGVDGKLAVIEALKVQHGTEANRYRWLAEQAEAAGDIKSAALFAKEAEHSAALVVSLSQQMGSAHRDLQAYAEAREAGLLAKTGGSKAAAALIRKSGSIGNVASLIAALSSGDDVEVTKAVASMAIGSLAGAVFGFGAATLNPAAAPAVAAAVALAVSETVPNILNDAQWTSLTELGKKAINAVAEPFAPLWHTFLRSFGGDLEDIASAANEKFLAALNMIRRIDPLVLDLDGDGVETLGLDAGVMFDFDGDGVQTATGWIKGDDGFLVMDVDGNGSIDTGRELFGIDTVKRDGTKARNGFDALADLDSNADGVFDAQDEMYSRVKIWQDLNHDGVAQADELKTLAEHHIAAILLKSKEANEDSNGNLISATGSFIRDDGTEGEVNGNQSVAADVDLESNPFYSEHTGEVQVSEEVEALPTLMGSGLVRELREAAMLSDELRSLLTSYTSAASHRDRKDILDKLIASWGATGEGYMRFEDRIDGLDRNGIDFRFAFSWSAPGKEPTDAQRLLSERLSHLNALESFNGQPFLGFEVLSMSVTSAKILVRMGKNTVTRTVRIVNGVATLSEADLPINSDILTLLDASYSDLSKSVEAGLLLQTHLKGYADLIDIGVNSEKIVPDFTRLAERLSATGSTDPAQAILDVLDLLASVPAFQAGDAAPLVDGWLSSLDPSRMAWLGSQLSGGALVLVDGDSATVLRGGSGSDLLDGNDGNDKVYGESGNDWLVGGAGNDTIEGGSGNDVLHGGVGNDLLEGGNGSDVYTFGRGDGRDSIYNGDSSTGRVDVLRFLDGIAPEDVIVSRSGSDLYLSIRGSTEWVFVNYYFYNEGSNGNRLDAIQFSDGTQWSVEDVKAMVLVETEDDDVINGYVSDDILSGAGGNDKLYGNGGNDQLDGGAGNDTIEGGSGNDVLHGGVGNDLLEGGNGSDVYTFGRGDGRDSIYNGDSSTGRVDVLRFLDGIAPEDVIVSRSGSDLYLSIRGSTERVFVNYYFYNEGSNGNRLDAIQFSDGTQWSVEDVKAMVLVETEDDDVINGYVSDDILSGAGGNDKLYGNGGNDQLDGGAGNDTIEGGNGNDVLHGGVGNDLLEGGNGSDVYTFDRGDGQDTIYNSGSGTSKDVIELLGDIHLDDLAFGRSGSSLVIDVGELADRITIASWFSGSQYKVGEIRAADGSSMTSAEVDALIAAMATKQGAAPAADILVPICSSAPVWASLATLWLASKTWRRCTHCTVATATVQPAEATLTLSRPSTRAFHATSAVNDSGTGICA